MHSMYAHFALTGKKLSVSPRHFKPLMELCHMVPIGGSYHDVITKKGAKIRVWSLCHNTIFCKVENFLYLNQSFVATSQLILGSPKIRKVDFNPLSANFTKWSNTLKQFGKLTTNCLSVFGHFVRLPLKGLKVVPATFLLDCFISLKESTCETKKNVFYFTSKALFVLDLLD